MLFKDLDIGDEFIFDTVLLKKINETSAINLGFPQNRKRRVYYISLLQEIN
jgi:hypothetical protein